MSLQLQQELDTISVSYTTEEPMFRHTTFGIGGAARYWICPKSKEELIAVLNLAQDAKVRVLILGRGSNVLFSDERFDGMVISTTAMRTIAVNSDAKTITADCGTYLSNLAVVAADVSLTGVEFAHGIPGTLGGAIRMNAGAYGGEMSQIIRSALCYNMQTGTVEEYTAEELQFSHRHSILTDRPELILLRATIQLQGGETVAIRAQMEEWKQRRRASQPLEYPSAGSVFKRPKGYFAGRLIEDCGLKGKTVGGAQVSQKHAGFIINRGGATAADVCELIAMIQTTVQQRYGVTLEPEVIIIK